MPWLAETNYTFPSNLGYIRPWLYMVDETELLLIYIDPNGGLYRLLAWPGDIASDGAVTMRARSHVIELIGDILDIDGAPPATTPFIDGVFALPEGGYNVALGFQSGG